MKKLAFTALMFAGLAQATGCIFVADDDDTGRFHATWSITAGGAASTCDAHGADYVALTSTLAGTAQGYDDLFDCGDLAGTTNPLPLGDYTIAVSIWDDNGTFENLNDDTKLNLQDAVYNESLLVGGATENLPNTNFDFPPPTGDVSFRVDFGNAGGMNCTSTGAGGSGVVQQVVILRDAQGNAVTATYTGVDQKGVSFTENTGANVVCMENTVVQTLQDLDPGSYSLAIHGLKGAVGGGTNDCYFVMTMSFTVNGDLDLGTILVPFDPAPADEAACNATKPSFER